MAKKNEWKRRDGVVYSTEPDYDYTIPSAEHPERVPPGRQILQVLLDKSGRAGKQVTVIAGFAGPQKDLDLLAKMLKTKCGVGGSVKDGEILIQGDLREKVAGILAKEGFKTKLR